MGNLAKKWYRESQIFRGPAGTSTYDFGERTPPPGPLMFPCYTAPLGEIAQKHCIRYHIYADDTQLYVAFYPRDPFAMENTLHKLSSCISEMRQWMATNYLKLNDSKTEFFITGSSYNLRHLPPAEITIGSAKIKPSESIRSLGVMFNPTLSLSNQVDMLRRSINFHVRNLWRIRRYIDQNTCHHVARALITSRLDYCNAMFTVLSSKDLARPQRLQNSAARVIFAVSRRVDASPLLEALHWLPVSSRITFKILLYVFKILNGQAPGYLTELLSYYKPARCLRSSSDTTCLVLHSSATAIGDKRFQIVAVKSWNLLPIEIRTVTSIVTFKKLLKTYLF